MRGDLDGYAKGLCGHVGLYVNTVAMLEYLQKLLLAFLAQHPNIASSEPKPQRFVALLWLNLRRPHPGTVCQVPHCGNEAGYGDCKIQSEFISEELCFNRN
jgi:hypothetical protein